ncbi:MAG: xanthine dehydrogenase family protein subunit M [Myxococcota bacterium]
MYPPKFDYVKPSNVDEVLDLLAKHESEAKIVAGGQSLIPMMKLRFVNPELLIDINGLTGLDSITENGELVIGAMCRHQSLADHAMLKQRYPLITSTGRLVADPLIRNLGTVGGSLVHADPRADWPSVMLAMNARLVAKSKAGEREIPITDFIAGPLTVNLKPTEMITAIKIAKPTGRSGGHYVKLERKVGDYATAAAATHMVLDDQGRISYAGIGLTGVGSTNIKATAAEQALIGQAPSDALFEQAGQLAAQATSPKSDVRGSATYKRHLTAVYVRRSLQQAAKIAQSA